MNESPAATVSTSGVELKPCPFCGGAAEIINTSVHCNNAFCEAQPVVGGYSHELGEAIAAWNRRAPPATA